MKTMSHLWALGAFALLLSGCGSDPTPGATSQYYESRPLESRYSFHNDADREGGLASREKEARQEFQAQQQDLKKAGLDHKQVTFRGKSSKPRNLPTSEVDTQNMLRVPLMFGAILALQTLLTGEWQFGGAVDKVARAAGRIVSGDDNEEEPQKEGKDTESDEKTSEKEPISSEVSAKNSEPANFRNPTRSSEGSVEIEIIRVPTVFDPPLDEKQEGFIYEEECSFEDKNQNTGTQSSRSALRDLLERIEEENQRGY